MTKLGAWWRRVEARVPTWLQIVVLGGTILGATGGFAAKSVADYRQIKKSITDIPITVSRLDSMVVQERVLARLAALESRRDTVATLITRLQGALEQLGQDVTETSAAVDLAVCLIRVQLGERRPLDCR